jgi:Tfp pilus assembly protein PilN
MKRLHINFAEPGARLRGTALERALCVLALCALAMALLLWFRVDALRETYRQELAQARQRQQAAIQNAPKPVAPPTISKARAAAVNGAVMQLNLPWRALNQAVGTATPPSVALLALEPDASKRTLKLTAETRNNTDMLAYVEQLKSEPFFADVALLQHDYDERDPARPLRFQLNITWKGEP